MKLAFLKAVFWLWFETRGYYTWSRAMRWLLERKYRGQKLTEYANFGQLEAAVGTMKWKQDPVKGMFDVISSPEKVESLWRQARADAVPDNEFIGDCDEFAVYCSTRIQDMIEKKRFNGRDPYFMTINWLDKDGKFRGHNICVFYDHSHGSWAHMGNWFQGRAQYGFQTVSEIATWFALGTTPGGHGTLIGYAVASPDLKKMYDLVLG